MEEEVEEEIRAPEATKGVTLDPKEVPPSLQEVPPLPKQPPWTLQVMQRISSSTTPICSMQLSTTPSTPCSCSNIMEEDLMEDLRDNLDLSRVKEDLLLRSSSNLIIILAMVILHSNKDIRSRLRSKLIMEENLN